MLSLLSPNFLFHLPTLQVPALLGWGRTHAGQRTAPTWATPTSPAWGQDRLYSTDAQAELLDSSSSSFPKPSRLQKRDLSRHVRSLGSSSGTTWHWYRQGSNMKPIAQRAAGASKVFGKAKQTHHRSHVASFRLLWLISTAGLVYICDCFISLKWFKEQPGRDSSTNNNNFT